MTPNMGLGSDNYHSRRLRREDRTTKKRSYPLTKTTDCIFCGAEISLVRRGTGKPWRTGLDYWYAEDPVHYCHEREETIGKAQLTQLGMRFNCSWNCYS